MTSLSATGLDALYERIQHEVDAGHVAAAQVAIGLDGDVAATHSFGAATDDSRKRSVSQCAAACTGYTRRSTR